MATQNAPHQLIADEKVEHSRHAEEALSNSSKEADIDEHDEEFTVEEGRKIRHRVDRRLVCFGRSWLNDTNNYRLHHVVCFIASL